jgi:hypothetical protein
MVGLPRRGSRLVRVFAQHPCDTPWHSPPLLSPKWEVRCAPARTICYEVLTHFKNRGELPNKGVKDRPHRTRSQITGGELQSIPKHRSALYRVPSKDLAPAECLAELSGY